MAAFRTSLLIKIAGGALAFALASTLAFGQIPNAEKLSSTTIIDVAKAGKPQKVIVEFESAGLEHEIARQRMQVTKKRDEAHHRAGRDHSKADSIDEDAQRQDQNLLQSLQSQFDAIKRATFAANSSGGCSIARDFQNIPMASVYVPDLDSLVKLLANQNVKFVHKIENIVPTASWPSSFDDVSIVHSNIKSGVNGYKGADTRVVVIDSGAYLATVPGWDDTKVACLPFSGPNFVQSNLAIGGTDNSSNCRIWSMFNMADSSPPCAAPIKTDGTHEACYGSNWAHGTLVDQIIARVAPSAYITNLQIYDAFGRSSPEGVSDASSWVVGHRNDKPRIVAVNYSNEVTGSAYSINCPNSALAPLIGMLRDYGILTVASTGNTGSKTTVGDPACVPGVIVVGATTDSPTPAAKYDLGGVSCNDPALSADQVPCFSNTPSKLTSLMAPGVRIGSATSVIPNDPRGILQDSGTSYSAPHVAGAIAILEGSDAYGVSLGADQITTKLISSGPLVTDRKNAGFSKHRLDILAALGPGSSTPPTLKQLVAVPAAVQLNAGSSVSVDVKGFNQFGNEMSLTTLGFTWSSTGVAHVSTDTTVNPVMIVADTPGSAVLTMTSGAARVQIPVTIIGKPKGGPVDCKSNPKACS